mmetsp:Transcript_14178/g.42419  ORF Transcript_14178/g.42419 Transcript_14178/m.42419 type:complete len:268 (-) Transcript_14178:146-949(-)
MVTLRMLKVAAVGRGGGMWAAVVLWVQQPLWLGLGRWRARARLASAAALAAIAVDVAAGLGARVALLANAGLAAAAVLGAAPAAAVRRRGEVAQLPQHKTLAGHDAARIVQPGAFLHEAPEVVVLHAHVAHARELAIGPEAHAAQPRLVAELHERAEDGLLFLFGPARLRRRFPHVQQRLIAAAQRRLGPPAQHLHLAHPSPEGRAVLARQRRAQQRRRLHKRHVLQRRPALRLELNDHGIHLGALVHYVRGARDKHELALAVPGRA